MTNSVTPKLRNDATALSRWLFIVAFMVLAIVVVGGITRLTESGVSITEWRPVSGTLPPITEAQWQAEFDAYRATPQYQLVNGPAGMTLETDIAPDVQLRANRELIGQALVNLIENALKYYDPAEGRMGRISLAVRKEAGRVRIEVGDNGPGIPEQDRARVVERFVRLEKSRTEPGSGLGLSLVAAVAQLHHGEFRIEDNKPGVRAVLDLPAAG